MENEIIIPKICGSKFIVFLGTDGTGKTTIINEIKPILDEATRNNTIVNHLRPNLLPPLARFRLRRKPVELYKGKNIDPHGSSLSSTTGSFIRLVYLLIDYIFGYWIITRTLLASKPTIIIFDRYAYDMHLDPRRFRLNLPARVIKLFTNFVPKPDIIICLYGTPETISLRKKELPLKEVTRQIEVLKEFAKTEPRAILISTDDSVEKTRDNVLLVLSQFDKNNLTGAKCVK